MIYKFAAADMDGTLLNDKNEITPYTIEIIRQAAARRMRFSFCVSHDFLSYSYFRSGQSNPPGFFVRDAAKIPRENEISRGISVSEVCFREKRNAD